MSNSIPATADNPHPLPPHGGNWERLSDGSLQLVEHTQEPGGDAVPAAAEPAAPTED